MDGFEFAGPERASNKHNGQDGCDCSNLQVLLTTRISLNSSAKNLDEMQLQALREHLEVQTKNFLDQVSTSDEVREGTGPLLSTGGDKQEVASKTYNKSSALVMNQDQDEDTDLRREDDCQEMQANMCDSTLSSVEVDPQETQRERTENEREHFALVVGKREQLLRQKRAAVKSVPPALLKSSGCRGSQSTDRRSQDTDVETKEPRQVGGGEEHPQTRFSASAADVMVESLRQFALLKPELGDIDRLSLGMKVNASRILAEFSVPLPLGDSSVRKKERNVSFRKRRLSAPLTQPRLSPGPPPPYSCPDITLNPQYSLPYSPQYPPTAMQCFPVHLPVVSQYYHPHQIMMIPRGNSMNFPPLMDTSSLFNQRPISSVLVPNAATGLSPACSPKSTNSPMSSQPESQFLLTPERYFQQIARTIPPIVSKISAIPNTSVSDPQPTTQSLSDSETKRQLEMEDESEKLQKEELRLLIQESQEVSESSNQSRESPVENLPVDSPATSSGKEDAESDSVNVQSLMATSEQHRLNIRCFMSRLPAQYRRKPQRMNAAVDNAKCDICGKVMARKGLVVHRRIHLGDKRFKCDICDRSFTQACNMRTHLKVHFKVKEHKCSDCGKVFSRAQHLYEHERIHTGERPYVCRFCGCSFKAYSTLYSHIGTHTGHKHECQVCHRTFAKACNLETHIRSKHADESGSLALPAGSHRSGGSESSSRDSLSPE